MPHSAPTQAEEALEVPPAALTLLHKISETIQSDKICIGGGYLRGLYMQQKLGLTPQMNDIDIFADISVEDFARVREALQKALGIPIRCHVGRFEEEENPRGLIEFALPRDFSSACGDAKSVQLNFGLAHPWADPSRYIEQANIGINQIAMNAEGRVFMSDAFAADMQNHTMRMNLNRDWTLHDWERTIKSMDRMGQERQEFKGWQKILVSKPAKLLTGSFWEEMRRNAPGMGEGRC